MDLTMPVILLGTFGIVFGVGSILLRSNAVFVLLALCGGEILAKLTAQDITQVVNSTVSTNAPTYSIVQIVLLLLPPVLVLLWTRRSVNVDMIWQIVPAASAAVLAFMFVVAKLPYDAQSTVQSSDIYQLIKPYFGLTIGAGMLFSLIWFFTRKPKHDRKKHRG